MTKKDWVDGDQITATELDRMEDQLVVICTSGTRPTGVAGQCIYETDTYKTLQYTGSAWRVLWSDWISFTPSWTNMTTSADTASYRYSPGRIQVTGTATVSTVTGAIELTIPNSHTIASEAQNTLFRFAGQVHFKDASPAADYSGIAKYASTTAVRFNAYDSSGTYITEVNTSGSVPINTWAAGDSVTYDLIIPYND